MSNSANFELDEHGLTRVRLETSAGFMFINFDADAEPLMDYLGNIPEVFASYNFGDMVCARRKEYDLECNWKIFMENAMEDYHTAVVHKSSIGLRDTVCEVTNGAWHSARMESNKTIAVLPEETTPFPYIEGISGKPASHSYFSVIYPTTFFAPRMTACGSCRSCRSPRIAPS
jgi:phenylpropionate dioxygenase-like ring-hydroxylating dioxygenase large terminal subunit